MEPSFRVTVAHVASQTRRIGTAVNAPNVDCNSSEEGEFAQDGQGKQSTLEGERDGVATVTVCVGIAPADWC
jgi:hypothetical protein